MPLPAASSPPNDIETPMEAEEQVQSKQTKNKTAKSINPSKKNYSAMTSSGLPPLPSKKRPRSENLELTEPKKLKKSPNEKVQKLTKEQFISAVKTLFGNVLVPQRNTLQIKAYDLQIKILQKDAEISYHYGSNKPIAPIICDFAVAINAISSIKNKHAAYKKAKELAANSEPCDNN